jgi:DNA-binding MarR family transcriptional regulator
MNVTRSKIEQEIRQRRPFPSKHQEVVVALLRTADQLKQLMTGTVEPFGITLQQYNVLRILRGAHPDPLLTLEVAARMIEHAPGITRLMDRLERDSLIRRERCSDDRRRVHCWITEKGLEIVEALDQPVELADRRVTRGLKKVEIQNLIDLLDRVRDEL